MFFLKTNKCFYHFFCGALYLDEGQTPMALGGQKSIFLMNENYLLGQRTFVYDQDQDNFTLCIYYAFDFWPGDR